MSKRVFIVTGAYGAIGLSIARIIAEKDHKVILIGRNEEKLKKVKEDNINRTGNSEIDYFVVDLSRPSSIKKLAENWKGPLHVLVNNASATPRERQETPDGIEVQWATNVLGYFCMMHYMHKYMHDVDDARIVNVASYWAGDLDLEDPEFKKRYYDNDIAYRQTKQADRMLTAAFAEKLKSTGITVNAAHPGDVKSKLSGNLGYGGHESPDQGAATPAWLALSPDLKNITGKYFEHKQEVECRFSRDKYEVHRLYDLCMKYISDSKEIIFVLNKKIKK